MHTPSSSSQQKPRQRHAPCMVPPKIAAVAELTIREKAQELDGNLRVLSQQVQICQSNKDFNVSISATDSDLSADADDELATSGAEDEEKDQDASSYYSPSEEQNEHVEDISRIGRLLTKSTSAVAASSLEKGIASAPWRAPSAAIVHSSSHRRSRSTRGRSRHPAERDRSYGKRRHSRSRSRSRSRRRATVRLRSRGSCRSVAYKFFHSETYTELAATVTRPAIGPSGLPPEVDTDEAHVRAHKRLRTMQDRRAQELGSTELPPWVGAGQIMVATWTVGKDAHWKDLEDKLTFSPFDVIVIITLPAVAEDMLNGLKTAARSSSNIPQSRSEKRRTKGQPRVDKLVMEKSVIHISPNAYIALHRAKVSSVETTLYGIVSQGAASISESCGWHLISVLVTLNRSRQQMSNIRLGVVVVEKTGPWLSTHVDAIVAWIKKEEFAIVTGYFGANREAVQQIGERTNAILDGPLAQMFWVHIETPQSRTSWGGWHLACIPTYFIFYGTCRKVTIPRDSVLPSFASWHIECEGVPPLDFEEDLVLESQLPSWKHIEQAGGHHLGQIKMKPVDFLRWCPNVHQTAVWIGTATPSINSQLRQANAEAADVKGKGKLRARSHGKDGVKGNWQ
jgi:hypothetical protein